MSSGISHRTVSRQIVLLFVDRSEALETDYDSLFKRIAASDRAAFEHLYRLTADALARYILHSVGSRVQAIDVVHDVFVTLWIRREVIRIRSSVRAYLYSAARNRALNILRRDARRIPTDFVDFSRGEPVTFVATSPEPDARVRELERMLAIWIAELPPRRAEAFLLSRYHDLTHAEIARIMELSERTVNTHVAHALRDLRRKLAESESGLPS